MIALLIFILMVGILQALLWGTIPKYFLNRLSHGYFLIKWKRGGFSFLGGWILIYDFHMVFPGKNGSDQVDIKVPFLKGRIRFLPLFLGRVEFSRLILESPRLDYINRIPARQKVDLLPKLGMVLIRGIQVKNGTVYIEDRLLTPTYKITLREIELIDGEMDMGCPVDVLFRSNYGRCKIGNGTLFTEKKEESAGFLTLSGITWAELAGLKVIPIPILSNKIDLRVNFTYTKSYLSVRGTLGGVEGSDLAMTQELLTSSISSETERKSNFFQFQIGWSEIALPFDLGLKLVILELFRSLEIKGLVNMTIHMVTKGILNIFTRDI